MQIIFDIGNVVLEWQPEQILRSTFGVADNELLAQTFLSKEWALYDQGLISTKELQEKLALKLACPVLSIEELILMALS